MKNSKKISRENLKEIQGGSGADGCGTGQLLCYDSGCVLRCMSGSRCKPMICID